MPGDYRTARSTSRVSNEAILHLLVAMPDVYLVAYFRQGSNSRFRRPAPERLHNHFRCALRVSLPCLHCSGFRLHRTCQRRQRSRHCRSQLQCCICHYTRPDHHRLACRCIANEPSSRHILLFGHQWDNGMAQQHCSTIQDWRVHN